MIDGSGSSPPDLTMHHRRRAEWRWLLHGWTPALLLAVLFAVEWPLAGFPWWPLLLVVGLSVLGRLLGFAPLIRGPRGAAVLVGLLVAATAWAWSPWLILLGAGAGLAVFGWFRLPQRRRLAAIGLGVVAVAVVVRSAIRGRGGGTRRAAGRTGGAAAPASGSGGGRYSRSGWGLRPLTGAVTSCRAYVQQRAAGSDQPPPDPARL